MTLINPMGMKDGLAPMFGHEQIYTVTGIWVGLLTLARCSVLQFG